MADMEIEVFGELKNIIERNVELLKKEIRINNVLIVDGADPLKSYSVKIKKIS